MPYQVNDSGFVDYNKLSQNVELFRPKLIICGASAYPRDWDYKKLAEISNSVGAYLMADIAHISGLVAAGEANNPFEYCDIVTTTTHKTLRGPRAGLIFFKKMKDGVNLEEKVNFAVFPSNQGGPHNNTIAAIATALLQVSCPEFKLYAVQVKKNARALADKLLSFGYKLVTNGTDNHLVLWDLRNVGLNGNKMEKLCDFINITLNKNTVHGDVSAAVPGGVRIGVSPLTSRSCKEQDFYQIADFLHEAVQLGLKIQSKSGKMLKDFLAAMNGDLDLENLKQRVIAFAQSLPMPGFDPESVPRHCRQ
jgi:glycine hydroxymethyltransferase